MTNELPFTFEIKLYRAVIQFKQEHPGALEARTEERRKRNETHPNNLHQLRRSDPDD